MGELKDTRSISRQTGSPEGGKDAFSESEALFDNGRTEILGGITPHLEGCGDDSSAAGGEERLLTSGARPVNSSNDVAKPTALPASRDDSSRVFYYKGKEIAVVSPRGEKDIGDQLRFIDEDRQLRRKVLTALLIIFSCLAAGMIAGMLLALFV